MDKKEVKNAIKRTILYLMEKNKESFENACDEIKRQYLIPYYQAIREINREMRRKKK